ncbi:hypothetical protein [Acetivibrio saccincola]|uniref:hypothetical protein n=1 Tax=Acetivibrio saccincola TaxID=1677857 RepID=UPI001056EEB1|nr:hypothetical protein [Acetivibrio saccincola]
MQYIFNVHEGIHEYIKLGRNYSFPPPPTKRCHNPKCNKLVSFRKHGFYERYYYSKEYKGKISNQTLYMSSMWMHHIIYS